MIFDCVVIEGDRFDPPSDGEDGIDLANSICDAAIACDFDEADEFPAVHFVMEIPEE